jgi:hypothetical protein
MPETVKPETVKFGGSVSGSNGPTWRFDREMDVATIEYSTIPVSSTAVTFSLGDKLAVVALFAEHYGSDSTDPPATFTFDPAGAPTCDLNQPVILAGGALTLVGAAKNVTLKIANGTATVYILIGRTLT